MTDLILFCVVTFAWLLNVFVFVASLLRKDYQWSLLFGIMAVWGVIVVAEIFHTLKWGGV